MNFIEGLLLLTVVYICWSLDGVWREIESMSYKKADEISRELKSNLINLMANLDCFTDRQLGKFIRVVLERENEKAARSS